MDAEAESDPICNSSGCTQYKHPAGPDGHPMDYVVPDFGQDHDINHSMTSEKAAEQIVGHKWDFKFTKPRDIV